MLAQSLCLPQARFGGLRIRKVVQRSGSLLPGEEEREQARRGEI